MKTLLISVYELGHQPLGLASPAAHILDRDLPVECVDLSVQPFDEEAVRAADFVGISIPMHTAIRLGVKLAERVRNVNERCHICFYGLYASLNGDYLLRTHADSVVGAEFEEPLVNLLLYLSGRPVDSLFGVQTRSSSSPPFLGRQEFLPPSRHLLPPLEHYARLDTGTELKLVGSVETSRGCAHQCLHCPITPVYGGRLRTVNEEVVLSDIRNLVAMGAQHITFRDPDFLNGVKHSMRIARRMHEEFSYLTFDATIKIEHILEHRTLIPKLREFGCIFIPSAVESLNDEVLRYYEKGHTKADVVEALEITRAAGLALRPSLVSFSPWNTLEDYLEVLDFVEEHGLIYNVDPVQYAIRLLVPPGSSLLNIPQMIPHIRELDEENFSYVWEHTEPRVDLLQRQVSRMVEEAAHSHDEEQVTFQRIKGLALSVLHGGTFTSPEVSGTPQGWRPPRLTESWFC